MAQGFNLSYLTSQANIEEQDEKQQLLVYPNPAGNLIRIEYETGTNELIRLRLFNAGGKQVTEQHYNAGPDGFIKESLSLDGLANGTYYLQLYGNECIIYTKIIKLDTKH